MKCAYCHREIVMDLSKATGSMINCHINNKGQIEKCYTKRRFPFSLLFGKKNFKMVCSEFKSNAYQFSNTPTPLSLNRLTEVYRLIGEYATGNVKISMRTEPTQDRDIPEELAKAVPFYLAREVLKGEPQDEPRT